MKRMLGALAATALAACGADTTPADAAKTLPDLKLLTSLPLVFAPDFSLEGGSDVLEALEARYTVEAIAATSPGELAGGDLLFMAHALPQTSENLVFLDEWVRGGGRVLLLADPRLDWDVGLPLGHPQAPPYFFGDTGLLGHWGLALEGPREEATIAGVVVSGAGRLSATGGTCKVEADGLVAICRLGEGMAIVIADADFLAPANAGGIGFALDALDLLAR